MARSLWEGPSCLGREVTGRRVSRRVWHMAGAKYLPHQAPEVYFDCSRSCLVKECVYCWYQIAGQTERESRSLLHEDSSPYPLAPISPPPCPCSRCSPHLHPELAKVEPVDRAWVMPAQREELGIKLPETPKTSITRRCTCGTEIECRAHD